VAVESSLTIIQKFKHKGEGGINDPNIVYTYEYKKKKKPQNLNTNTQRN
jgi:hypothetical protein